MGNDKKINSVFRIRKDGLITLFKNPFSFKMHTMTQCDMLLSGYMHLKKQEIKGLKISSVAYEKIFGTKDIDMIESCSIEMLKEYNSTFMDFFNSDNFKHYQNLQTDLKYNIDSFFDESKWRTYNDYMSQILKK